MRAVILICFIALVWAALSSFPWCRRRRRPGSLWGAPSTGSDLCPAARPSHQPPAQWLSALFVLSLCHLSRTSLGGFEPSPAVAVRTRDCPLHPLHSPCRSGQFSQALRVQGGGTTRPPTNSIHDFSLSLHIRLRGSPVADAVPAICVDALHW